MSFDPVSYAMGKQAGGGGGGVTVEPLSVTENGTYTAPSGKAYSPVMVEVPTETKFTMTYTAAEESSTVVIPMPSLQYPKHIEIITETQGSVIEDFVLGEVINIFLSPHETNDYVNAVSGYVGYRNASTQSRSSIALIQVYDDALYSSWTYSVLNANLSIKMQQNALFLPGITYTVNWYY